MSTKQAAFVALFYDRARFSITEKRQSDVAKSVISSVICVTRGGQEKSHWPARVARREK
jgi:hypothetical protein